MNSLLNHPQATYVQCQIMRASGLDAQLWQLLAEFLAKKGVMHDAFELSRIGSRRERWSGNRIQTPEEILNDLEKTNEDGFRIRVIGDRRPQYSMGLGAGEDRSGKRLLGIASQDEQANLVANCGGEIIELIASNFTLHSAWLRSGRYHAWMNEGTIDTYERRYGSTEGFRKIPCGPPPVDFDVLDISNNPGREEITRDFRRAVAAEMWFGDAFWETSSVRIEEILAQSWLRVRRGPGYTYIQSWPQVFTLPDGEQGTIQRKMWRLLYQSDCSWPPVDSRLTR